MLSKCAHEHTCSTFFPPRSSRSRAVVFWRAGHNQPVHDRDWEDIPPVDDRDTGTIPFHMEETEGFGIPPVSSASTDRDERLRAFPLPHEQRQATSAARSLATGADHV